MADGANIPILPLFEGRMGQLREMRFWSKVDMRGPDECWDWQASCAGHASGYGRFKVASHTTLHANRVAWALANKRDPGGLVVRHSCDQPRCCNPAHLAIGTVADNNNDKIRRGRHRNGNLAGIKNPQAKLTEAQVAEIVERLGLGESNVHISRHMPVGHALVSRIRVGLSWRKETEALGWRPAPLFDRRSARP